MADRRGLGRLPAGTWLRLAALTAGGLLLLLLAPSVAERGTRPPVMLLLLVGLLLIAGAGAAVYGAVRFDLGLPAMIASYAVGYNALIILVKFLFGPYGLYEVNQTVAFESVLPLTDTAGAVMAAGFVLVLYLAAYLLVYRISIRGTRPSWIVRAKNRVVRNRRALLFIVGGALLVAASAGMGLFLLMLVFAANGLQYIDFVFSSSASLMVAILLASATILLGLHFREAGFQGRAGGLPDQVARNDNEGGLVADAAGVAGLFWLGLCFIALYHVLWVVYILVLTSIWPLRTVVPK